MGRWEMRLVGASCSGYAIAGETVMRPWVFRTRSPLGFRPLAEPAARRLLKVMIVELRMFQFEPYARLAACLAGRLSTREDLSACI